MSAEDHEEDSPDLPIEQSPQIAPYATKADIEQAMALVRQKGDRGTTWNILKILYLRDPPSISIDELKSIFRNEDRKVAISRVAQFNKLLPAQIVGVFLEKLDRDHYMMRKREPQSAQTPKHPRIVDQFDTRPATQEEISAILEEIKDKQKKYKSIHEILIAMQNRTPPEISIEELTKIFGKKDLVSVRMNGINHQNRLLQQHGLFFAHHKSGRYLLVKILKSQPADEIPIDNPKVALRPARQEEIEKAIRLMNEQEEMGAKKSTTTRQILENLSQKEGAKIDRKDLARIYNGKTPITRSIARINTRNQLFKKLGLSLQLSKDRKYYTLMKADESQEFHYSSEKIIADLRRKLAEALTRAERAEKIVTDTRAALVKAIRGGGKEPDTVDQGSDNGQKNKALTSFRLETLENLVTQDIDPTLSTIKTAIFHALQKVEGITLSIVEVMILRSAILIIQTTEKLKTQDKIKLLAFATELRKIRTATRKSDISKLMERTLR